MASNCCGACWCRLGAALLRWWLGPQVQTEVVQRRDVLQTVVASGRVETPHRVNIGAQITGTVARVPVTEGQTVKAGDVLVELVGTELQSARRQAQQAVVQAQNRLRQMNELQGPAAADAAPGAGQSGHGAGQLAAQSGFVWPRLHWAGGAGRVAQACSRHWPMPKCGRLNNK